MHYFPQRLRIIFITVFILLLNIASLPPAQAAPGDCTTDCYVSLSGNDANTGVSFAEAKRTIQNAVDTVSDGGNVFISLGEYVENVEIPSGKIVLIDGVGAGTNPAVHTIIDGNDTGSVFNISGGNVTLRQLTIRDGAPVSGDSGSGVTSQFGTLTIQSALITSNSGGGIYSNLGNDLTITMSTISDNTAFNGAGIRQEVSGDLMVINTTISGNTSTSLGGGIFLTRASSALIQNSTITGNNAVNGAGIFQSNTDPVTIVNSTLSGNTASGNGGAINNNNDGDSDCSNCSSITEIINTTIYNNSAGSGGGIFNQSIIGGFGDTQPDNPAILTIVNSIVGNSTNQNCVSTGDNDTLTSEGHNLSDDTSCLPFFIASGDINDLDPLLGPLATNGGFTQTHALLLNSPALQAGDQAVCAGMFVNNEDQRGEERPQVAATDCDMGAFESALEPVMVVECTAVCYVSLTGNDANGGTSFVDAKRTIQNAVDTVDDGGDVIVAVGTYVEIVNINKDVTITGQGSGLNPADDTIVDGNDVNHVFEIESGNTVELVSLTITNGSATFGGGIFNDEGDLTIRESLITANESSSSGGGIRNNNNLMTMGSATLTIIDSTISNNESGLDGGGVDNFGSTLSITGSTISGNTAATDGGGVASTGFGATATLTITNSTISGNSTAFGNGGGVSLDSGLSSSNATITNVTIANNTADDEGNSLYGPAITSGTTNLTITNTLVASASGDNCFFGDMNVTSAGGNLSDDTSCAVEFTAGSDLNNTNPQIGSLANNGGSTQTHALLFGSPAIDAAVDAGLTDDQRGVVRPQGADFDIGAFEFNTEPGSIRIFNQANPAAIAPDFEFNPSYPGANFFLLSGANHFSGPLGPGVYTVEEIVPIGWRLLSIVCNDDDSGRIGMTSSAQIVVGEGEDVECTFNNEKLSNIIIVKNADADLDQPFDFTFNDGGGVQNFSLSDPDDGMGGDGTFDNIPTGTYTISEINIPPGWELSSIVCESTIDETQINIASPTTTINLRVNEDVTCTYTNVPDVSEPGSITIFNQANPAAIAPDFEFDPSYPGANFLLLSGASQPSGDLAAGVYTVEEIVPIGWRLVSIVCNDGDSGRVGSTSTAQIVVGEGEDVICTFNNEKLSNIVITKNADADLDQPFDFTIADDVNLVNFTLTDPDDGDGGDGTFDNIPAGTYVVSEINLPAGWSLSGINCGAAAAVVDLENERVTITLGINETVNCEFTNTLDPVTCADIDPEADLTGYITVDGNTATGYVTNHSDEECAYVVGLASYRMFDNIINNQELFDSEPLTPGSVDAPPTLIPAGGTVQFTVDLPDCATQVDLFYGPLLPSLNGQRYDDRLLQARQLLDRPFCTQPVPDVQSIPDGATDANAAQPIVSEDFDGDGLANSVDPDIDNDGRLNELDPAPAQFDDVDGDGLGDGFDADADNDGIPNDYEAIAGITSPVIADALDYDADGFSNADEIAGGFNPYDPASHP